VPDFGDDVRAENQPAAQTAMEHRQGDVLVRLRCMAAKSAKSRCRKVIGRVWDSDQGPLLVTEFVDWDYWKQYFDGGYWPQGTLPSDEGPKPDILTSGGLTQVRPVLLDLAGARVSVWCEEHTVEKVSPADLRARALEARNRGRTLDFQVLRLD